MTAAFTMTGTLRLVPSWVDDLTAAAVTDSASVLLQFPLTNGTGSGQANGYYKDVITVPATGTASVNLRSMPLSVLGGSGTLSLACVKVLLVRNRSTTRTLLMAGNVSDRWSALFADAVTLPPSTSMLASELVAGWAVTTSSRVLQFANAGAAAADVEVYVVGVKA